MMTFEEALKKHKSYYKNYLNKRVYNSSEHDEILQLFAIKLYKYFDRYDDTLCTFTTYSTTILNSVLIDYYKSKNKDNYTEIEDYMYYENLSTVDKMDYKIYIDTLLKLDYGFLVYEYYTENLSYEELANKHNLNIGTLKKYIHDTKKKFKKLVGTDIF